MATNEIVMTILFVIGVTALLTFISFRGIRSYWKGTLINKKEEYEPGDEDSAGETVYALYFKTDEGKTKRIVVSQKNYNEFNIGDRVEKRKGEYFPRKL